MIAACDPFRYAQLGAEPGHRSCCDNFAEALAELSIVRRSPVPAPLNLFMNIPWDMDGNITFEPTVSKARRQRPVSRRSRRDRDRLGVPDGHRADQRARWRQASRRGVHPLLRGRTVQRQRTSAAVVDQQAHAGDVARLVGRQEHDGVTDRTWLERAVGETPLRPARRAPRSTPRRPDWGQRALTPVEVHRVDADRVSRQIGGSSSSARSMRPWRHRTR